MRKNSISVVIPAYNEENRILPTLKRVREYLKENFEDFEILVVDDGSTDNTASVVKDFGTGNIGLIQNKPNMGKGVAVKKGVLSAKGSLILICDADMSTPIEEVEKLITFIEAGFDIAIGSRGMRESDLALRQPWYREGMGRIFNLFVRTVLFGGIKDTQCGFKLFRHDAAQRAFGQSLIKGFSFDAEVIFIAKKMGYRIKEVPIKWLNSPASRVRLIKDPLKMFLDLLRIRAYWISGRYRL